MTGRTDPRAVPGLTLERSLHQAGFDHIAGLDEAGRGAWAGPVVAAAVVLPLDRRDLRRALRGVRDSKLVPEPEREILADRIRSVALGIGVGAASADEVDRDGLLPATRAAMRRALLGLDIPAEYLLLDYMLLPELPIHQTALPHGDARVLSIAAASIIAKVSRDELMRHINRYFPGYGFDRNKGYGTPGHRDALHQLGPSPVHRHSYQPVAQLEFASIL
jgi:ribonuclease HII